MMHKKYYPRHADEIPVRKTGRIKRIFVVLAIACFCCLSVAQTLAFISTKTEQKINTFVPAQVSCEISESFENNVKKDVKVQNTGNTDAYIRAAIVVNWKDKDGNIYGGAKPILNTNYTLELNMSDWAVGADGYYYHRIPIAPNQFTEVLIRECKEAENSNPPAGYSLSVEIVASAIQDAPVSTVQNQWHVTVQDGKITAGGEAQQ